MMKKIIISGAVAVIVFAAVTYFLVTSGFFQKSEEETLNNFTEDIQNQNYDELYSYISEDAKSSYAEEDVGARNETVYNSLGVENVTLENVEELETSEESESEEGEKHFSGDLTLDTSYGELNRDYEFTLSYNEEADDWFVEWTPELIIPGLGDDEVRIDNTTGQRGDILDKDGDELAFNGVKETVGFNAGSAMEEEILAAAEDLEMSEDSLQSILDQSWIEEGVFVPIKDEHRFSDEDKEAFDEHELSIKETPSREYVLDEATYHLLGYVGEVTADELEENDSYESGDTIGKQGIEKLYEETLRPTKGYNVSIVDENGKVTDELFSQEAQDGEDVQLTIDREVQDAIYSNMEEDSGASVAMDPENGDMLATVSYPSPSPYDFMFGISQEEYDALNEDEENPLLTKFNRTTSPGSTQKILSSIIAMNDESFNKDDTIDISGNGWQKDDSWGGYSVNRYHEMNESFDLKKALTYSDNIYFARMMLDLGAETFIQGMEDLGIGMEYDTDYPIYTSQAANENTIDNEILLADSGYGQGQILISPIQITSIYAAVINGGNIHEPHILTESEDEVMIDNITSQDNLDYLEESMRAVVTENHPADTERDYAEFAGKTGTSENKMSQETRGEETGWFVGYDQSSKDMMLSLYAENVQDRGMSEYTAQKFAEIHDDLQESEE